VLANGVERSLTNARRPEVRQRVGGLVAERKEALA
jgi:hypothetical protein